MSGLTAWTWPSRRALAALGVGALALVLWGTELGRSVLGLRDGYEEHEYLVLHADGPFEVRRYQPALVARTSVPPGVARPEDQAFRRLAGYIFGKNAGETSIAMTVPVVTEAEAEGTQIAMTVPVTGRRAEGGYQMHFVLPSKWTLETLPAPLDPEVELGELPAQTFAVFRFSGVAYPSTLDERLPALQAWMSRRGLEATGPARMAFYDPPWTLPFLRRNEVLVPIDGATVLRPIPGGGPTG